MNISLDFDFNIEQIEFLKEIVKTAKSCKLDIFFAGGIVRDCFLKKEIQDIDLIVEGNAVEFSSKLPEIIKIKSIHKDFGTVKIKYKKLDIDIASTRVENYESSGSLPVVDKIGVKIEDDFIRRDFTINAMYLKINLIDDSLFFELFDFAGGISDIQNKKLKVLHNKSYIDDPTRIIRGVDFNNRFGFDFSEFDKKLINEYFNSINRENYSTDRIKATFLKVFSSVAAPFNFEEIIKKGYYKILFDNEIKPDIGKVKKIIKDFNLDKNEISEFYYSIIEDNEILKISTKSRADIYEKFLKFKKAQLAYYFYKTEDKNCLIFNEIKDIKINLKGSDLLALGYKQGVEIGKILISLFREKLENPDKLKTIEDEINWVKNH